MPAHVALVLVGTLLVASPEKVAEPPRDATPSFHDLTDAQAFSAVAGKIVGAATVCDGISRDRVSAAAAKVEEVASSIADDDDELTSARELFAAGTEVGKRAARNGAANCELVDASLTRLQQLEAQER
jgi:hypothetical protein